MLFGFYRYLISPVMHSLGRVLMGGVQGCKYEQTCSQFAELMIHEKGFIKAAGPIVKRVMSCQPWGRVENANTRELKEKGI
jgi:putative component of membrane protein insertase Oxa1/YidC/SpoIIIJ protein YidD